MELTQLFLLSEFLSEEGQEKFWNFVEASQNIKTSEHDGSDYSSYHEMLKAACHSLSPLQQNLLKFSLALRSYSATVQAFQQIAADEPPPKGCTLFFAVHGDKTCEFESLGNLLQGASERPKPFLFKGDHKYPVSNPESPVVILYAEIGSEEFYRNHRRLVLKAEAGEITYVLRHYIANPSKEKVYLSGYGVELAIKSTEYKAKDDTQVKGELLFQFTVLNFWVFFSLLDLSFQSAARILTAPPVDGLMVMKDLSQNFPTMARAIMKTVVSSELRAEIEENQKVMLPESNMVLFKLFTLSLKCINDFSFPSSLIDVLRNEARVMEGLHSLGIEGLSLHNVLKLNIQPSDSDYAVDIRSSAISWINNLEVDSRYNSWPSNVQELLRPTFPGVIRQIRKNFHNFVLIVDPVHETTAELLNVAEMFFSNHIPLRIGLVFVVNDSEDVDGLQDPGVALLRTYNYVAQEMDNNYAFQTIYNKVKTGDQLKVEHVVSVLEKQYPYVEINSILGIDSAYDQNRKAARGYYEQTGVGPLPVVLFNGMPFQKDQLDPDDLETVTMHKILETTNVVEYIMNQPNVVPRINSRILMSDREYLDLTGMSKGCFNCIKPDVSNSNTIAVPMENDSFVRPVTFWIVGDFDKPSGRQLLYDAIKHQKSSNNVRIGMINNPSNDPNSQNTVVAKAIWAALQTQTSNNAKNFITKMAKEETAKALKAGADILEFAVGVKAFESPKVDFILSHAIYCRDVLKLKKGQRAVISNGRPHVLSICNLPLPPFFLSSASDLVMKVDALLSAQPKGESRIEYHYFEERYSAVKLRPKEGETYFDVVAIVDPVTRDAQRLAPLLLVLNQLINMNLRVFMNCQSRLSDMPLKSFYRYVLEPEISFTADNNFAPGPIAKFLDMPQSPLFTLNLNTPESWMVESVRTPYDLDNIYLVDNVVAAEYELEYLLLEGHCYDITTGQPPRGLQFTLGTSTTPVIVDTIVMANLGYFQLKANPGAWTLRLRKGRSEDIYRIYSHDGTDSPPEASEVSVVLNNFKSKIIKVKVTIHHLLHSFLYSCPLLSCPSYKYIYSFRGFTGGQKNEDVKQDKDDVLNIFSVASGHLYERFLRIMMLSVLKHTKTPLKFWFLKNYLSPTFKEFIPYMAKKYNFQYELVQYKWPRWLHQQTEKQRIIWGYKILFLDVLFPLAVDKILFVDADQIVRTDLKELRDFNLDGAPYGYTPFCDSRREMDGYRFWKSGYWASHLAGRKYHISALYVVDLKKFRKIAAGDRLRGQYQGLSQDPNSLSNLDQDLPNNMIHQVPIKSLPQEWLWCETWCDDSSKKRAKTIDLCNNPMTKEPKLQAAMRIVPEWQDYDQEIKQLQSLFQKEKETGIPALTHALNGILFYLQVFKQLEMLLRFVQYALGFVKKKKKKKI
uniref:UDP-glucose ceramide glucosyltransferase-like 1 n=1 Tax=Strigops habroptila TaxID=2489341 RepID=A0A672UDS4_STRHB